MKGVVAGAGVLVALEAPLVVPNKPPEGAALEVPNMPPEGALLEVPNMPPEVVALEVPNMLPPEGAAVEALKMLPPEGAALEAPNIPPEGGALEVPNMPLEDDEVVVLAWLSPPNGLLCGGALLNMDDPPNAGAGVLPLVAGAEFAFAKGLDTGVAPPAVKLKPVDDGGWKAVLSLFAPKAGKEELLKVLLGAADCAGGKLLVVLPPKGLLAPKPPKPFVPLLAGAGAEAPKLKLFGCGAPKFALCARFCARALANTRSRRRILRRPATENRSAVMLAQWVQSWLRLRALVVLWLEYSLRWRLPVVGLWQS